MKRIMLVSAALLMVVSCGAPKSASQTESRIYTAQSLEGEKVTVEEAELSGVEEAECLNDDGTKIIKLPFKWFSGNGVADVKQVAIEMAQREAYATISRVIGNKVHDEGHKGGLANNGHVQQALKFHWDQVSESLQRGCEPFGKVKIEYSQSTRMYKVTAKVAVRGDRFNKMMNEAGAYVPKNLTGQDLDQFIEVNKKIMEAAKSNN